MATFSLATLAPAMPEVALSLLVFLMLVIDAFLDEADRYITYWLAIIALAGTALLSAVTIGTASATTFHGLFVADYMSQFLKAVMLLTVAATLMMSREHLEARGLLTGEFLCLALFSALGMMVMISAHHFLTLYLGLELMALAQYAIVALQRDSVRATEAGMKYFVLGALSSGLLLYGLSMIYGATGSLDLRQVAFSIEHGQAHGMLATFGLVFVVAGIAFKLGNAPFHMWIPDVYHGASTPATMLIGAAPKIAAFAFVMRLLANGLQGLSADWQQMLWVLAAFSLLVGNVVAIAQTNVKRMLAYSTISHMGFVVVGILAGNDNGYRGAMFYVVTYAIMTLGSFGVILLLSRAGFEAETLDDFKGLNQKSKWYAFVMLVMMFSLTGLPPTAGFFGKLFVLEAALDAGYTGLVVFAVVMSVVGAYYYLRIVKLMYMDAPAGEITVSQRAETRWTLTATALLTLFFGMMPGSLFDICGRAISAML